MSEASTLEKPDLKIDQDEGNFSYPEDYAFNAGIGLPSNCGNCGYRVNAVTRSPIPHSAVTRFDYCSKSNGVGIFHVNFS